MQKIIKTQNVDFFGTWIYSAVWACRVALASATWLLVPCLDHAPHPLFPATALAPSIPPPTSLPPQLTLLWSLPPQLMLPGCSYHQSASFSSTVASPHYAVSPSPAPASIKQKDYEKVLVSDGVHYLFPSAMLKWYNGKSGLNKISKNESWWEEPSSSSGNSSFGKWGNGISREWKRTFYEHCTNQYLDKEMEGRMKW